jgi:hypothetical protein
MREHLPLNGIFFFWRQLSFIVAINDQVAVVSPFRDKLGVLNDWRIRTPLPLSKIGNTCLVDWQREN